MGDFTGFTFNNYHSWDDLGIVRVSDGDRYKDDLLPDFDDATISIPGGDGIYYFGSYYKSKKFIINFAFDTLTEQQYRNLRRVFSTRKPSTLIFDEYPYKAYKVKVEGPPTIDAVCFDEKSRSVGETVENGGVRVIKREDVYELTSDLVINPYKTYYVKEEDEYIKVNSPDAERMFNYYEKTGTNITREDITPYVYTNKPQRIYKGEGEINLIAYEPFAHAPYKTLDDYESDYVNVDEWAATSGILSAEDYIAGAYDTWDSSNKVIPVYNPGDLSAPFQLYIPFSSGEISAFEIALEEDTESGAPVPVDGARLKVGAITRIVSDDMEDESGADSGDSDDLDSGVIINTKNHLIEGVKDNGDGSYTTTGTVYNNYIIEGDFFNINCDGALGAFDGLIVFEGNVEDPVIIYDYIYF